MSNRLIAYVAEPLKGCQRTVNRTVQGLLIQVDVALVLVETRHEGHDGGAEKAFRESSISWSQLVQRQQLTPKVHELQAALQVADQQRPLGKSNAVGCLKSARGGLTVFHSTLLILK